MPCAPVRHREPLAHRVVGTADNTNTRGMGKSFNRFAVLAAVIGGHVLLFGLFVSSKPGGTRGEASASDSPENGLVLVQIQEPQATEPALSSAISMPGFLSNPGASLESSAPSLPSISGSSEAPAPSVDWSREAERTAQSLAPGLLRKHQRHCEEEKRHGRYPDGCKKPASEYEPNWEPEQPRAGFEGILPYVRLGKRKNCVIGLGFFGCTFDPPPPDGTLFSNMNDPERPRSSVPEPLGPAWPEAPGSLAASDSEPRRSDLPVSSSQPRDSSGLSDSSSSSEPPGD